jgi:hypothetical protein
VAVIIIISEQNGLHFKTAIWRTFSNMNFVNVWQPVPSSPHSISHLRHRKFYLIEKSRVNVQKFADKHIIIFTHVMPIP